MSQSPHSRGTPSRVGEVISDPKNNIGALYSHARVLAKLDSLLSGFAGPELAPNFQVANFHQDRLVLIAPSASWATRLRLQATGMLCLLHSAGYHQLRHIDVRVSPLQRQKC